MTSLPRSCKDTDAVVEGLAGRVDWDARATAPRSLAHEFERLRFAERVAVPTPTPIAVDVDGDWFGRPALVMRLLPGRTAFHPEPGRWTSRPAACVSSDSWALPCGSRTT